MEQLLEILGAVVGHENGNHIAIYTMMNNYTSLSIISLESFRYNEACNELKLNGEAEEDVAEIKIGGILEVIKCIGEERPDYVIYFEGGRSELQFKLD